MNKNTLKIKFKKANIIGLLSLIFVFLFSFLAFKVTLVQAPIINATAFNITSNADLNSSTSNVRFTDGKLIGGVASNGNLTVWDTFSDGDFTLSPTWTPLNFSASLDGVGGSQRVEAHNNFLNITVHKISAGQTTAGAIRQGNLTFPPSSGTFASLWVDIGKLKYTPGINLQAYVCFVTMWNIVANRTGDLPGEPSNTACAMGNTSSSSYVATFGVLNSGGSFSYVISWLNQGTATQRFFGSGNLSNSLEHWTIYLNDSNARFCINETEGGGLCSNATFSGNIVDKLSAGGEWALEAYTAVAGEDMRVFNIHNFSAGNLTKFELPYNLTSGRLETPVFNKTANVNLTKISNQTHKYSGSSASFQTFDNEYVSLFNITEGIFTSLGKIMMGIGSNATITPSSLYTSSEFSSFLIEWTGATVQLNFSFNSTSFQPNDDIGILVNYSSTSGNWTSNETFWFRDGQEIAGTANSTTLQSQNLTHNDKINFTMRAYNNITYSSFTNTTITINDTVVPVLIGNESNRTSGTNGNQLTIAINASDVGSNISELIGEFTDPDTAKTNITFVNTSLNNKGNDTVRFVGSITLTKTGEWGVRFFATDYAGNTNRTPNNYLTFVVNAVSNTPSGGGGGGGGGCDAGYTNVNGTCIPTENLTKAPQCGDNFCDAFAKEDPFSCPLDCKFKSSFLSCSTPGEPCFFKTQKPVAVAVGFIIGGGVLFLSVSKGGKGKDVVEKAKNWLRRKRLWKFGGG